jgi:hypothetical protein
MAETKIANKPILAYKPPEPIPKRISQIQANTKYRDINEYLHYIETKFQRAGNVKPGCLYAYKYDFLLNPENKGLPHSEIKFWDFFPLSYCFAVNLKQRTFTGLNMHRLPFEERLFWLDRIKKMYSEKFKEKKLDQIPIVYYEALKGIGVYKKSTIWATRQYALYRGFDYRIIPLEYWDELFKFYASTFYGVNYNQVASKYRKLHI